ncbi:MAG: bacterial Ig-like domain-containing protein, partial [Coprobacillus sp.]
MKIKIKKKTLIKDICTIVAIIVIICGAFFLLNKPVLSFSGDNKIEINSIVDYSRFVEKVNGGEIEDVEIDSSKVTVDKLGKYEVIYKYKDKELTFEVEVVDSVKPIVKTKNITTILNSKVEAKEFVEEVKDATKTTVTFAKNYKFDTEGEHEIEVVVKDEAGNETIVKAKATVEADKTAPEITGGNINFVVGSTVDLKELVKVKDNFD